VKLLMNCCEISVRALVSPSSASIGASAAATDPTAFASTSIESVALFTGNVTDTIPVPSAATITRCVTTENPGAVTTTVYEPAGNPASEKCPASSAVPLNTLPLTSLLALTEALAIIPPLASATDPWRPGPACAIAIPADRASKLLTDTTQARRPSITSAPEKCCRNFIVILYLVCYR
jgi:hypothetical protein